jgi:hypothetical protein
MSYPRETTGSANGDSAGGPTMRVASTYSKIELDGGVHFGGTRAPRKPYDVVPVPQCNEAWKSRRWGARERSSLWIGTRELRWESGVRWSLWSSGVMSIRKLRPAAAYFADY